MPILPGDVVSHSEMCVEEGASLQRGMNYRLHGDLSVILMSLRSGAPYADRVEDNGRVLIYEGHDAPKREGLSPKAIDQPMSSPRGRLTQNGQFFDAAMRAKRGESEPERVKVFEKIWSNIRVFNGIFALVDAWLERVHGRQVFKFRLELLDSPAFNGRAESNSLDHTRVIPSSVKLEVWKRDHGRCVVCGSTDDLHFDHIIPYSRGGSSLVVDNVQLLCARHNLMKRNRIE